MKKYKITLTPQAKADYQKHILSGNKKLLLKIIGLLEEIEIHLASGTGQVEMLKFELSGKWSRRINKEHRMIYEISGGEVVLHSMFGHY